MIIIGTLIFWLGLIEKFKSHSGSIKISIEKILNGLIEFDNLKLLVFSINLYELNI